MRFGELRSLVQLAESGSLRATAAALHLSPSAIHKQLRTLQDELGLRLYHKVDGELKLTEEGRLILPNARNLLIQHDRTLATVQEWKGLQRGVLRVGSGPTIATYLLPALLEEFRLAHPKIDIVVETGSTRQLLNSIEDGTIQLALLVDPAIEEEQRIKEHLSWEFEIVLVSSPQSATRSCSIRKLTSQTFVLFKVGARIQQAIDQYFQKHEFHPRIAMRFDNADAIKAMVRGGFGLSMLPFWAVAADLRRHELQLVRQTEAPLLSRIGLVSASDMHQPRAVEAFIELARRFGTARWDLLSSSDKKQQNAK